LQTLLETTDRLCRTTHERFQIVECRKCRVMRLQPRLTEAVLGSYARPGSRPEGKAAADRIESAWRRFVLADDVNFTLRAIRHAGAAGPVLDMSFDNEPFRKALARHGVEVIAGDTENPPAAAAPECCAAVTLLHVLDRVDDPSACLEAARALLRPEGRLIVQLPNAACWQFLLLGERWSGIDVPRRLIQFRGRDLELLLECCGFEVIRRKYFSLRNNPADLAASLEPGLDPAVRRARGVVESPAVRLLKNLLYIALSIEAVPLTALEAACRAGSTITIEARKKW
jgi:SAM-dependent methyltransferase